MTARTSPPRFRPRMRRPASAPLAIALALALLGGPLARAEGETAVEARLGRRDGDLCVVVTLRNAFDPEIRGALESGLPITVRINAELWRHRSGWWPFDDHVGDATRTVRVRWDPGERRFTVETVGRRRWVESFETIDAAEEQISNLVLRVASGDGLARNQSYFAVAEALVQHITLDEVHELDGWVRGKLGGGEDPPAGPEPDSASALPEEEGRGFARSFFGVLLRWVGFQDRVAKDRTETMRLERVPPVPADL